MDRRFCWLRYPGTGEGGRRLAARLFLTSESDKAWTMLAPDKIKAEGKKRRDDAGSVSRVSTFAWQEEFFTASGRFGGSPPRKIFKIDVFSFLMLKIQEKKY